MGDLPRRIGKYTLRRRLGGGGMGEVYLATLEGASGFERDIAIKLVRTELASKSRMTALFVREGRALAALNHRNVIQVFELAEEGDQLYLAMEYLRGVDLSQIRRARGALDWRAAAFIAVEAARGLAAAHGLCLPDAPGGIIHGDISPSNIMACRDGAVKVLDFGLARPAGFDTMRGVNGKLPYLPPEALVGAASPDERSDVYALGVVLYELLVGERLFRDTEDVESFERVVMQGAAPPSTRMHGLPPALDALVMSAIERDVARRPRASDFADELERVLDGRFGAADLVALVAGIESGTPSDEATPAGRTRSAWQAPRSIHTEPASEAAAPPRARRSPKAAIAIGLVLGGAGIAAVQLLPRDHEAAATPASAASASPPVAMPAPAPPPPPTPPTPTPSEQAPAVAAPSLPAPAPAPAPPHKVASPAHHSRRPPAAPAAPAAAQPTPKPADPSAGIDPGYLADPFGSKRK